MIRLLEDEVKTWLSEAGIAVPLACTASTPEDAMHCAARLGGEVFVKALVPAGRRGKAGAVLHATSPAEARDGARVLLGQTLGDHIVREVYVEARVAMTRELYCGLLLTDDGPRLVLSGQGGVDIEALVDGSGSALVSVPLDVIRGLNGWHAIDLWHRVGIRGPELRALGRVTSQLYERFIAADAELLEVNPLGIDPSGQAVVVGAMMGVDASALGRHPGWRASAARVHPAVALTEREQRVQRIDREVEGPECRYVELDGDIGLLVGGGGAGLYVHDRVLANGGRPSNHSVTPPTGGDTRKLRTVIEAILDHPHIRTLLVAFNFAQMARADIRVHTLMDVIDERGIHTNRLPIVIRLFGAGENDARARVAGREGIHYLPRSASLDDAARLAVELARGTRAEVTA